MSKTKLTLRVATLGKNAGDEIEVDGSETADYLVQNGHAVRVGPAKPQSKD